MPNPSRETKFSGANADTEIFIFPVQLTTSRIGNLTYENPVRVLHGFYTGHLTSRADTVQAVLDVPCEPYTRRIASGFDLVVVFSRIKVAINEVGR